MQSAYEPLAVHPLRELERIHERHLQTTFARLVARELDVEASRRERMRLLFADHEVALTPDESDEAEALYRRAYDVARRPVPGVVPLIAALRERGLKLAVVTNGLAIKQREKLRLCELADAFDALVLGGDLGLLKPDPAIFHHALTALRLPPESAVVLGDSWKHDVVGAQNAGIRAVWFNRYEEPHPEPDSPEHESVATLTALTPLERTLALLLK
jgi:putative hydrolase of the HAD superfamily